MLAENDGVVTEMIVEIETGTNTKKGIGMIVTGTTAIVIVVAGMLQQSWKPLFLFPLLFCSFFSHVSLVSKII